MNELQKTEDKGLTEFVPFGASDKIKLSINIVKNLIAIKTKSGKTCSDNDAIKFVAMCLARRLNPFEGDAYLIGYDSQAGPTFSLITAHQAFLKRAELNSEYDGMKSGVIVEEDGKLVDLEGDFYIPGGQKLMGGWATVYFKNRKQPMHKRIRLERFAKKFGVWLDDPGGMISKCAEADALRSSFPTMLGGLYLKEEIDDKPVVTTSEPIFKEPPSVVEEALPQPTPFELLSVNFKAQGVTEKQVMEFLHDVGSISEPMADLEELEKEAPEVLEMLIEQQDKIIERIKNA